MSDFNPIQFGEMIAELKATRQDMARTRVEIEQLTQRISDMESHWLRGKASLAGLVLGLGFAILGVKEALSTGWKALTG